MSEYWKQSPNYWCKHCSVYVRDTKLERQNHEATAKHQGAIKRSLRDLHRTHEREEREKERARREIDRLNGVVTGSKSGPPRGPVPSTSQVGGAASQRRQHEQLAELGVSIPSDFRPEMAMPGEWTVTSTRVIDKNAESTKESLATGVRKREETEEEREHEEAVKGLFKKPRRWGRDTKVVGEDDGELDALLSEGVVLKKPVEEDDKSGIVKADDELQDTIKKEESEHETGIMVKEEADLEAFIEKTKSEGEAKMEEGEVGLAPVVFKKRKPKGLRTK